MVEEGPKGEVQELECAETCPLVRTLKEEMDKQRKSHEELMKHMAWELRTMSTQSQVSGAEVHYYAGQSPEEVKERERKEEERRIRSQRDIYELIFAAFLAGIIAAFTYKVFPIAFALLPITLLLLVRVIFLWRKLPAP